MQVPQQAQYTAGGMGMGDPSQSDPSSAAAVGNQVILDPYTPLQDQLMQVRRVVGPAAPIAAIAMSPQAASQQGYSGSQQQGLVPIAGTGAGQARVSYLAGPRGPQAQQGLAGFESTSLAAAPLQSPSAPGSAAQSSLSYAVSAAQLPLMQANMFNIQSISGAQMSTQSYGPGMFCVTLTGTTNQVEAASQLVTDVLAKSGF
jgi:hypothetical protein